jgi:hypothetical protein
MAHNLTCACHSSRPRTPRLFVVKEKAWRIRERYQLWTALKDLGKEDSLDNSGVATKLAQQYLNRF